MFMSNVTLEVECYLCKETTELVVKAEDYEEYLRPPSQRRYIQDIFPYLKPSERELLISNTCDRCWHYLFSEEAQTNE